MIFFQRMLTARGPADEVAAWAVEITELVKEKSDLDISLWQGLFGFPVGTLAWSTRVPNLTELEHAMDGLAGEKAYNDLAARATDWVDTPPQDSLLRLVHAAGPEYQRGDVGTYSEITLAVPAEGKMRKATEFGTQISDLHSRITHSAVLFANSAYGAFGELRWMAMYDSATAVDTAAEIIAKDDEYVAALDEAGDLFVEGSGQRGLARRIA